MDTGEKKLSDYIDRLNAEKKPEAHENPEESEELNNLFAAVRMARSLKEPALPEADYPRKLASSVAGQLSRQPREKSRRRIWVAGVAAAAVFVMAILLNFTSFFGGNDAVYAMEKAYRGVKAYHGILQIVETNAAGTVTTQEKLEVWADKEGRYYLKELEGSQKDLVTVNNGQMKWQVRPDQKQVYIFPAFPDPYRYAFELGKEVEQVKSALSTKPAGEETVGGRQASILEVTPQGGAPYRIWIDQETKLPLQKQYAMQNALQYEITYASIDFYDEIPAEMTAYNRPEGFKEVNTNPEQLVNTLEEAVGIAGFTPKAPAGIPAGFTRDGIAVANEQKIVKFYYTAGEPEKKVVVLQRQTAGEFKPAPNAIQGKIDQSIAEIQAPVENNAGILGGGGPYAGVTDINSIRWQEAGFEYAVVGDVSLEELASFVKSLTGKTVEMPPADTQSQPKPAVEVPVDLTVEGNEQKSVDAGHTPWRLDPVFVAQVFVSLKISPAGIQGDYPVKTEDLKVTQNTGKDVIVEVGGDKTPVKRVYLKRLVRQDATGIWTVVGYDPK